MKECKREGCPGIISHQRGEDAKHCSEVCRVLHRKQSIERRRITQAERTGNTELLAHLRSAWVELVAVGDAVSAWRAALARDSD